jgi:hypothetical protein
MWLADALFGPARAEADAGRRWWLRYAAVACILVLVIVGRRPDAFTRPQFWEEDGFVFFYQNLTLGFLGALRTLHEGFPYLIQRLLAAAGGLVPFAAAPRVYATASTALTALAMAAFCLPGFRHLVRSDALRGAFCVACVCLPSGHETILATPTNLGWFLAVWLFLISLVRLPRSPAAVGALAACGVAVAWSTPLAALCVPLWLLRASAGVLRRDHRGFWFAATLLLAFGVIVFITRNLGAQGPLIVQVPESGTIVVGFKWHNLVNACASTVGSLFVRYDYLPDLVLSRSGLLWAGSALFVATLVGTAAVTDPRRLPVTLVCLIVAAGELSLTLAGRPVWNILLGNRTTWDLPRHYAVFPTALALLAITVTIDGVRMVAPRAILTALVGTAIAWAWWPSIVIAPLDDLHWPVWAARLETKLATGSREPLVIPVHPLVWPLRFDAPAARGDGREHSPP